MIKFYDFSPDYSILSNDEMKKLKNTLNQIEVDFKKLYLSSETQLIDNGQVQLILQKMIGIDASHDEMKSYASAITFNRPHTDFSDYKYIELKIWKIILVKKCPLSIS